MTALVVGNPRLPSTVTEQWGWSDIPHAEQEATMVAEMLQAKALVGSQVIDCNEAEATVQHSCGSENKSRDKFRGFQ